jgi:hypothetical protein
MKACMLLLAMVSSHGLTRLLAREGKVKMETTRWVSSFFEDGPQYACTAQYTLQVRESKG